MKMLAYAVAATALAGTPALAQDQFDIALQSYVDRLSADCAALGAGTFTDAPEAVRKTSDVNGDGVTDPIVDAGAMSCSSSATLTAGGSGGREISVFVSQDDGAFERFIFLGDGMLPLTLGRVTVLIVPKHGSSCGLTGTAPCYAAYSWAEGGFVSGGGRVDPASDGE